MKKINLRISQKITGGFLILIVIFTLNAILNLFTLNKSATLIRKGSEEVDPSLAVLQEFILLATNSQMYTTNWIYMQANSEDKEALKKLHAVEYPQIKERIVALQPLWDSQQKLKTDTILADFESLLTVQKAVMNELVKFEDYEDGSTKLMNENRLESEVVPLSRKTISQLNNLIDKKKLEKQESDTYLLASFANVQRVTVIAGLVLIIVGIIAALFLARSIINPINFIRNIITQLGRGELPEKKQVKFSKDEIGEMAEAVEKLVAGLRSTSFFAENIGKGNYEADYQPLSEKDVLGNALIEMRYNLKRVAEDDKKRNWATEGMAKFGELLRKNNDNISNLSDEIISNLVKYTHSNQGGLFIVNEDAGEPFLELKACYAWDKKKYLEQQIHRGEGLTGQAWQEGDIIHMTEIPDNYISITSGLGESNPRSIIIVPLKVNDVIYGVVEIASFNDFAPHEIEFVEKIAESIASTISSVKVNERTQRLLEDSTIMTEQMRAQEEEMRQNMEELQATQEEMQRSQRDADAKDYILNATQLVIELDKNFRITQVNSLAQAHLNYNGHELIGLSLDTLLETNGRIDQIRTILNKGEIWSAVGHVKNKAGKRVMVKASAGGIMDQHQNVTRHIMILDEIDELQNVPVMN
jgi:PAS domain S-box-containing protein